MRVRNKIDRFDIINTIAMIVLAILLLLPLYQCLVISLNDGSDLTYNGIVYLWPRKFSLESYYMALTDRMFIVAARNSALRTVFGSLVAVIITSCYAYALSHKTLVMRRLFSVLGIITLYFGGGLIPTFLQIRALGLYDTFFVYIFPMCFTMFNCLVFLTYFKSISGAIKESAMIDGANDLRIYVQIIVPISMPVFACVMLFSAVFQWNEYFDCMIYTSAEELSVLSYRFAKMIFTQQYLESIVLDYKDLTTEQIIAIRGPISTTTLQMATMIVTIIPIVCTYPFLQRYFVKGIMLGSLKG